MGKGKLHGLIGRKITEQYPVMSKGQKAVADYILSAQSNAASLTAAQLAAKVGVSASTVVRFAYLLEYAGYPEFQEKLADELKVSLTATERLTLARSEAYQGSLLRSFLLDSAEHMRRTAWMLDDEPFQQAAAMILQAERVFLLGLRSSAALAAFLAFYLKQVLPDVRLLETGSQSEIAEQILPIRQRDLLIVLSFPRYSQRSIKALEQAKEQGAMTLAVTDREDNPLASAAQRTILAASGMVANVDDLSLPFAVISALAAQVTLQQGAGSDETLEKLEKLWADDKVYVEMGETADQGRHDKKD